MMYKESIVRLTIYDVTGILVKTLVNENRKAGYYSILWDEIDDNGQKVSRGIYFYCMKAGNFKATRKLTVN
ncbi:MAG: T9SS type A sorting domain-containing protein [Candidatus Stahlbacteria bacterium]|nr:T9SS type A sorting domain-containing protein [Candidatus Stahlbacteria bacterium]